MKADNKKILISFVTLFFLWIVNTCSDAYVLGPEDLLEIHAWDASNSNLLIVNPVLPGLTTAVTDPYSVRVSRDGKIYIPMIGSIIVKGMEVNNLEGLLLNGLRKFSPLEVNLRCMVSEADLSQNVILEDGDTVIVSQAVNKIKEKVYAG